MTDISDQKNYSGMIKGKERVTIALDEECAGILKEFKNNSNMSQSEIFRKALKFYEKYGYLFNEDMKQTKKIDAYLDLLADGEHVILDVDHYLSILKFIENSHDQNQFWEDHRQISKQHAEQFKDQFKTFNDVITRLEICNLFKIIQESSNRYTLLLGSDISKNFIKTLLEEIFNGMNIKADIKDGFAKLRVFLQLP